MLSLTPHKGPHKQGKDIRLYLTIDYRILDNLPFATPTHPTAGV